MTEAGEEHEPNRRAHRLPAEVPAGEAAELKRRYLAGATLSALLADFDGSYRTLRAVLQEQGVTFRAPQPMTPPAPPGLVETYASGKSIIETGRAFGLGRDITKRMLLDAGVELRGRGRPPRSPSTGSDFTDF
ncbi:MULTISPECIES: helix-turn-helix domain-containing protein [Amycolatopsis]|uniref:Helix-turn-helix domain-containing protein n=1 Tax=Amycolatopsis bullii TaxID=941987 RepID=A0ABQ3KGC6_9PSEU|nr:hypothetical protein [Amycolatopsis bullii]GHG22213.1 hypothetical protein GCM10017567_46110 [Amycolatopsis bullii]